MHAKATAESATDHHEAPEAATSFQTFCAAQAFHFSCYSEAGTQIEQDRNSLNINVVL